MFKDILKEAQFTVPLALSLILIALLAYVALTSYAQRDFVSAISADSEIAEYKNRTGYDLIRMNDE